MVSFLTIPFPTRCIWGKFFSRQTASFAETQLAKELKITKRYIFANRLGSIFLTAGAFTAGGGIAYGASLGNGDYAQIPAAFCITAGMAVGGSLALMGGLTRLVVRRLSGMSPHALTTKSKLVEEALVRQMLNMKGIKTSFPK